MLARVTDVDIDLGALHALRSKQQQVFGYVNTPLTRGHTLPSSGTERKDDEVHS
jgi:hypothetical protein